jgi:hypothetical protein
MSNIEYEYVSPSEWLSQADLAEVLCMNVNEMQWTGNADILKNFKLGEKTLRVVIRHGNHFIRHSNGPLQHYFWDAYPDDLHTVGLALRVLILAPRPFQSYADFCQQRDELLK